jgi:hypothetical protein
MSQWWLVTGENKIKRSASGRQKRPQARKSAVPQRSARDRYNFSKNGDFGF